MRIEFNIPRIAPHVPASVKKVIGKVGTAVDVVAPTAATVAAPVSDLGRRIAKRHASEWLMANRTKTVCEFEACEDCKIEHHVLVCCDAHIELQMKMNKFEKRVHPEA